MRRCPTCTVPLREVFDRGVEVDHCGERHGVYFDRGEVERFIGADPGVDARLLAAAHRQATRSPFGCPGCSRPMLLFQSTTVAAHLCQYCGGAWVDGTHLPQIDSLMSLPRGPRGGRPATGERPQMGGRPITAAAAAVDPGMAGMAADVGIELATEIAAEVALEGALEVGGTLLEVLGEFVGALFSGL